MATPACAMQSRRARGAALAVSAALVCACGSLPKSSGAGAGAASGSSTGGSSGGSGSDGASGASGFAGWSCDRPPPECRCESHDAHDYLFCAAEETRDDAEASCVSVGMHLVHVGGISEELWMYETALASGITDDFWSGGIDAGGYDWQWADGTHFWSGLADGTPVNDAYAHFRKGEPNASGGCVVLQTDHRWDDQPCEWTRGYVCEAPGGTDTVTPYDCTMAPPLGCTCRTVGSSTDLFCNEEAGFDVARVVCLAAGMHLVRIQDATEDRAVRAIADELGIESYFADGTDRQTEGQWRWSDTARTVFWTSPSLGSAGSGGSANTGGQGGGSAVGGAGGSAPASPEITGVAGQGGAAAGAYVNWAAGQPNDSGDCLRVAPGPEWDDTDCIAQRYVCERP